MFIIITIAQRRCLRKYKVSLNHEGIADKNGTQPAEKYKTDFRFPKGISPKLEEGGTLSNTGPLNNREARIHSLPPLELPPLRPPKNLNKVEETAKEGDKTLPADPPVLSPRPRVRSAAPNSMNAKNGNSELRRVQRLVDNMSDVCMYVCMYVCMIV